MDFKVISDIFEAQDVWNQLLAHNTLDDEWNFRYAFIKNLPYTLKFIVALDNSQPIALLPLQYNSGDGLLPPYHPAKSSFLEFFGGDDTDDNLVQNPHVFYGFLHEFLQEENKKLLLAPLATPISYENTQSKLYTHKYIKDISKLNSYEDFIDATWTGKNRSSFKRGIRNVEKLNEVKVEENNRDDIELLSMLNVKRFGRESSFNYPYRKQIFYNLIELYDTQITTIVVNGKKQAVSFGIFYKDVYYAMNVGVNPEINNLGKLLNMLQIQKAIDRKCNTYDAGKGDSGWKELYKLEKIPQYQIHLSYLTLL